MRGHQAALQGSDRSEIIWTDADIAEIKKAKKCSAEVAHAIDLAAHTGLRLGDLLRLSRSHVREDECAIVMTTGKSKHRREVIIPLYDELRVVLAHIPKRATTILANSQHRPWKRNGFGTAFNRATRFYNAGLSVRVIAEIMGWEEAHVEKIIRRYVGRSAATKAIIQQLNQTGKRT